MSEFKKSSHSWKNGNCVEVLIGEDGVRVRDSKEGDGAPIQFFSHTAWRGLTTIVRQVHAAQERRSETSYVDALSGAHDLGDDTALELKPNELGGLSWKLGSQPEDVFNYTGPEIDAWCKGVVGGEFDAAVAEEPRMVASQAATFALWAA